MCAPQSFAHHAGITSTVPDLTIDWCSHEASKYAVMNWHYSQAMPVGKLVKVGAWEQDRFIGAVLFGRGAAPSLGRPYGLHQGECCELVRVALDEHAAPTSQIVAAAIRMLKQQSPGLRLIVSFADEGQGHMGTLYQAGNWIYLGVAEAAWFRVRGELVHPKTLHSLYGQGGQSVAWLREHVDPNAERVNMAPKHRYAMPLDRGMRRQIRALGLPYPTCG